MVKTLLAEYREVSRRICAAIAKDEHEKICVLDLEIDSIFQRILDHQPEGRAELLLVVEFLLDQMCEKRTLSGTGLQARERLTSLILSQAAA